PGHLGLIREVQPPRHAGATTGHHEASRPHGEPHTSSREDLGTQLIEGVLARGTRTTTVLPAGSIGNAQEIRIVSEQWFSEDLQVLVLTKHSDPRSAETTYRLRHISRAEPDPSLFTVPADYRTEERRVRHPE
ncbi:MAG TPA: hypothetical protein VM364_22970, partial [Vicinamibacterales bacterium]|nr:hypothetical protein [Vicinamibacterales bacterium]